MKKLAACLLLCASVLSLAACGGSNQNAYVFDDAALDHLVSDYGFQWTDPDAPILNEKGAEELSFQIYSSKNASALDYNDMKIMQDLFDQTQVTVNWENVSESVYSQQKNLIFGNVDDRPDAIYHAGMSSGEIMKYAKRGVFVPISDYLEYMPNFAKILEERPDIKAQLTNSEDGKIYSLPRIEEIGLVEHPNILFLNKNWAAQAIAAGAVSDLSQADLVDGITLTAQQMEDLLRYFKENDMNGNGDAGDERPLSFVYNNWQGNQCDLFGMFGLNDNLEHRVVVDGQVTYTIRDERFKEATNFLADWVSEGLIDKVSFEITQDNFLANGKGEETYGAFYWWESETVVSNPENYIVCCPLIGPNGDQTACVSNNQEISIGEMVIFSQCENFPVLLAYLDRYYAPLNSAQLNYGPIGIVYEEEPDANGKLVQKPLPEGVTADELRLQNAPMGIIYLSDYAWENVVNLEDRAQLRVDRLNQFVKPYVPDDVSPCPNLQFTLDEWNTLNDCETSLNNYVRTTLIQWLLNGGVSDSEWDAFQKDLEDKVQIDRIQGVYQAAYDRFANG